MTQSKLVNLGPTVQLSGLSEGLGVGVLVYLCRLRILSLAREVWCIDEVNEKSLLVIL